MPIRVQMPNGTVRRHTLALMAREGTPKSVIRRAIADMLAELKASGNYDGFDFSAFEHKPRKVVVTQTASTQPLSNKGFIRLPQPDELEKGEGGEGYMVYGTPPNGDGQWGTEHTMQVISAVASHLANGNRYIPFSIGNISRKNGEPFPPHSTNHQTGEGIDVRPPRLDQHNLPTTWQSSDYDRAAMQDLVDAFYATGTVDKIFFNDPQIHGVIPARDHDNHFHVQLKP